MHQDKQQQAHPISGKKAAGNNVPQQVKLQQMQDDFLKWLDSMENTQSDLDPYTYKKVR